VKLVIAIVRPEKANDVLEALYRAEVRGVSISRVQGHGGEVDRVETYRGTRVQVGLSDKVRFEVAVSDEFVETTIEALCAGARTGEVESSADAQASEPVHRPPQGRCRPSALPHRRREDPRHAARARGPHPHG